MSERARRGSRRSVLGRLALASIALAGATWVAGCESLSADSITLNFEAPDYQLGGQTGSLIPGCGVAPLSAEGQSVPVGRSLAVFYAQDCPELAAEGRLPLSGVVGDAQQLELVPITDTTYLLQSAQSLPAGDYQLELPAGGSELRVTDAEPAVPSVFGSLSSATAECSEVLRFTLALDDAALALAPLARFELRMDGGAPQLWVDYGALRIEQDAAGERGVLELPRCTAQGCLSDGSHQLELRVSVAGQSPAPEPSLLDFDVCPLPESDQEGVSEKSCALGAPRGTHSTHRLGWLGLLLGLGWRRRSQRAHSVDPLEESDRT